MRGAQTECGGPEAADSSRWWTACGAVTFDQSVVDRQPPNDRTMRYLLAIIQFGENASAPVGSPFSVKDYVIHWGHFLVGGFFQIDAASYDFFVVG